MRLMIVSLAILLISRYSYALYPEIENLEKAEDQYVLGVFAARESRSDLHILAKNANVLIYNIHHTSSLDYKSNSLRDVYFLKQDSDKLTWHKVKKAPMPHFVYDYSFLKNKKNNKKKQGKKLRRKLIKQTGIYFLNNPDLVTKVSNKRTFASAMQAANLNHPDTYDFNEQNLVALLLKNDLVFVKPIHGSGGKGIFMIERSKSDENKFNLSVNLPKTVGLFEEGDYETISDFSSFHKVSFKNLDIIPMLSLMQTIGKTIFNYSQDKYVVQQGIYCATLAGRKFDLRVNTQRNQNNEVQVTSSMVRVGGNISQGGYFAKPKIISQFAGGHSEKLIRSAYELALASHAAIEKLEPGKYMAELGVDIIFDDKGIPVVIEANAKPGYISIFKFIDQQFTGIDSDGVFKELIDMDQLRNSVLLDYMQFLKQNFPNSASFS